LVQPREEGKRHLTHSRKRLQDRFLCLVRRVLKEKDKRIMKDMPARSRKRRKETDKNNPQESQVTDATGCASYRL
jgi:hypothetical protein